jgi:hypothetical protein
MTSSGSHLVEAQQAGRSWKKFQIDSLRVAKYQQYGQELSGKSIAKRTSSIKNPIA